MQRVAGQEQCTAFALEMLLGEPPGRDQAHPSQLEQPFGLEPTGEPGPGSDRRERTQQRVDESPPVAVPGFHQLAPPAAISGGKRLKALLGHSAVRRDQRALPAWEGVSQGIRGSAPTQTEVLQTKCLQYRRCCGQRIERAEKVMTKAGKRHLPRANGATRLGLCF